MMRFAVDAGIRNAEAQQLIRDLTLPIGVGIFGQAAAERRAGRHRRLPQRRSHRALRRGGSHRGRHRHPLDGGRSAARRRRGPRRAGRVLEPGRRLRRFRACPPAGARRPRGGRDLEPAAHRAARGREGRAGPPGRRPAHARRDRGTDRGHPRPGRGAPVGRRCGEAAHRVGRRAPDADGAGRPLPAPDRGRGRQCGLDRGLACRAGVPAQRRDQRPRRRAGPGDRDRGLHRRPADPARAGRSAGRPAPRAARHGIGAAAGSRGRGDRHARGLLRAPASVHRRRARAAPGPRRPGRHRHRQLAADRGSAPPRRRAGGPRRGAAHPVGDGGRADVAARPVGRADPDPEGGGAAAQGPWRADRHGRDR